MKNVLMVALLLFVTASAFASGAESDTVRVKKKKQLTQEQINKRNAAEKKFQKFSKDRFAIDLLGTNWIYNKNDAGFGLVGSDDRMRTKWWSRGINIYFYYDFRIKKSRFSIAPGIGYSSSNIYSRHGIVEDSTGTRFQPLTTINPSVAADAYKVNKLTLQYLDIPVEFRIKTNPDKLDQVWKFAIGFKAGIRVDAHTKIRTKINNEVKVNVERRFPDFNLFRFGPTLRIGYSSFNITAYYGVLDVFKKGLGPKANEFSVGISFNGL